MHLEEAVFVALDFLYSSECDTKGMTVDSSYTLLHAQTRVRRPVVILDTSAHDGLKCCKNPAKEVSRRGGVVRSGLKHLTDRGTGGEAKLVRSHHFLYRKAIVTLDFRALIKKIVFIICSSLLVRSNNSHPSSDSVPCEEESELLPPRGHT